MQVRHARIGRLIERTSKDNLDSALEALAHHFRQTTDEQRRIDYGFQVAAKYMGEHHYNIDSARRASEDVALLKWNESWDKETILNSLRSRLIYAGTFGASGTQHDLIQVKKIHEDLSEKVKHLDDLKLKANILWKAEFHLAKAFSKLGDIEDAQRHYEKARKIAEPLNSLEVEATILYQSSFLYEDDDPRKLNQISKIYSLGNDVPVFLRKAAITGLILTMSAMGNIRFDDPLFAEAENLIDEKTEASNTAILHYSRATINLHESKFEDAEAEMEQAIRIWNSIGLPRRNHDIVYRLFLNCCKWGHAQQANRFLTKLKALSPQDSRIEDMQKKLQVLQSNKN